MPNNCDAGSSNCSNTISTSAVALEVWPPIPNVNGWTLQEFINPTVENGTLWLKLESSIRLTGQVISSDTKQVVSARIIAWRDSLIPGRPEVQTEAIISSTGRQRNQKDSIYELWLNKNLSYSFYVVPESPYDTEYPPFIETDIKFNQDTLKNFILSGKDQAIEVKGVLRDFSGSGIPPYTAQVRAFQAGGFNYSTISTSNPKTGEFNFKLPAGVRPYTIRIESAPGATPIPTLDCSNKILGQIPNENNYVSLGTIHLPAFLPVQQYSAKVLGDNGTPISNAIVTFSTQLSPPANEGFEKCTANYAQSAQTDSEGKIQIPLLPGNNSKNQTYSVTIVSPPSSEYASQVTTIEVGAKEGFLADFTLAPRNLLHGVVVLHGGKPISGANVEAFKIKTEESDDILPTSQASAITDSRGNFDLYLDTGIYNIIVNPPNQLDLPGIRFLAQKIDNNLDGLTFELPDGRSLSGLVTDNQEQGINNAQVLLYEFIDNVKYSDNAYAPLLGRSVTDSSGSFRLSLPIP